jgi:hypothetical protein
MDTTTFTGILEWTIPVVIVSLLSRWFIAQILRLGR